MSQRKAEPCSRDIYKNKTIKKSKSIGKMQKIAVFCGKTAKKRFFS